MDEPENLNELDASLVEAWNAPEKLPAMIEWLNTERSDAAQAQYGYIILKKYLARRYRRLKKDTIPTSWWALGWDLYLNIDDLVRWGTYDEMLKAMFVELVNFCEMKSSEFFAYNLKELLEKFIGDQGSRDKISWLLPAKALEQFDEIDRMLGDEHEDYLRILDQQGY